MAKKNNTIVNASTAAQNEQNGMQTENPTLEQEKTPASLTADTFKGYYFVSTDLNVREEAKSDARILGVLKMGAIVSCDGEYALDNGIRYLHIKADLDGAAITGYCQVQYLVKQ